MQQRFDIYNTFDKPDMTDCSAMEKARREDESHGIAFLYADDYEDNEPISFGE